jgi:hypothetical protein
MYSSYNAFGVKAIMLISNMARVDKEVTFFTATPSYWEKNKSLLAHSSLNLIFSHYREKMLGKSELGGSLHLNARVTQPMNN